MGHPVYGQSKQHHTRKRSHARKAQHGSWLRLPPVVLLHPSLLPPIGGIIKTGVPEGCPGPSVANILCRGGRPAEVRHVPHNKGVGCRGVDNLALDALPTVPPTVPLYEANRGGAARGGVDVALGARPSAVLLRPQAGLAWAPAFILFAGRGSCARKRRGVPADVAGAPYIRTQGHRPLYCRWPRCTDSSSLNAAFALLTPLLALPLALRH